MILTAQQRVSVLIMMALVTELTKISRENAKFIREGAEPIRLAASSLPPCVERQKLMKSWAGLDAVATAMEEVECA